MSVPDVQDANLVLRLYELRRESVLREARDWFIGRFRAQTFEQFQEVCPIGSDNHRMYRMVVSYWDMVGAFINNGVMNPDLYFQTTGEHLIVWSKVEPFIEKARQATGMPWALGNLEQMAKKHLAWIDGRHPGGAQSVRNMFKTMQEQLAKSR